ncbi:2,3-dimethylmalate dehydratase small subunit [Cupriavidus campinensis]|uniref:LeuD/DmdB family oxidoreductase small subunit n=1 Tax=Cupriavidus campinensis TaxID=151783 RepID=UPI001B238CF0|nr:3-isopropylmalate dehydratase [Cupriavidus campinensis]CAG2145217.1 2,3-dimethylmalate dehydratase small subunit [Cupriavidus campinensis]
MNATQKPVFGRAWVFGDDVNTDLLAPGAYMKYGIGEIAKHCLEALDPTFAQAVQPGDVVIGGRNFGAGSSREQAVEVLRHLGVAAVVAPAFAGLFYRNGFNLGLPLLICPEAGVVQPAQRVHGDIDAARVHVADTGAVLACESIPPHLVAMIRDGGLVPHLARKLAARQQQQNGQSLTEATP